MSLPEGTAEVRVLYKRISTSMEEPPESGTVDENGRVMFEEGAELPLDVAEKCWSVFSDRLAAFDADGNRLDSPSRGEKMDFDMALFHHR